MKRIAALLVVGAMLPTAACSSGKSKTVSAARPVATTTTAPATAGDQVAAERATLKLSDLPSGWTSAPHENTPDNPGIEKALADCLHVDVSVFNSQRDTGSADSPDFSSPQDEQVTDSVSFSRTTDEVQSAMNIIRRPTFSSCLGKAMDTAVSADLKHPSPGSTVPLNVSFGQSSVAQVSFPSLGDQSSAYRITIPISVGSIQLKVFADLVIAAKGRGAHILTFIAVGSPFSTDLAQLLSRVAVDRLST